MKILPACLAIIAVGVIEVVALIQKVDGLLLISSLVIISGLGGYELKNVNLKQILRRLKPPGG